MKDEKEEGRQKWKETDKWGDSKWAIGNRTTDEH